MECIQTEAKLTATRHSATPCIWGFPAPSWFSRVCHWAPDLKTQLPSLQPPAVGREVSQGLPAAEHKDLYWTHTICPSSLVSKLLDCFLSSVLLPKAGNGSRGCTQQGARPRSPVLQPLHLHHAPQSHKHWIWSNLGSQVTSLKCKGYRPRERILFVKQHSKWQ